MSSGAAETIRLYLEEKGGTTEASLGHLLTTFGVEASDEAGRDRIQNELEAVGVVVPRSLRGLGPDARLILSVAATPTHAVEPDLTTPLPSDPPLRICRKCSAQSRTVGATCPNCGASFMRGLQRFSKRTKVVSLVVPVVLLLGGGGTATALKVQHDNRVEEKRQAKAAAERKRHREERLQASREREADDALEEIELETRKELVKSLEKSISKDAKGRVAEGLLDGPILSATCEPLSGAPEEPDVTKGRFECMAVTQENGDGTQEGYRFAASANYDTATYRWHLGS